MPSKKTFEYFKLLRLKEANKRYSILFWHIGILLRQGLTLEAYFFHTLGVYRKLMVWHKGVHLSNKMSGGRIEKKEKQSPSKIYPDVTWRSVIHLYPFSIPLGCVIMLFLNLSWYRYSSPSIRLALGQFKPSVNYLIRSQNFLECIP